MAGETALLGIHNEPALASLIGEVLAMNGSKPVIVDNLEDFLHQCRGQIYGRYVMDLNLSVHGDDLTSTLTALETLQENGLSPAEAKRRLIGISGMTPPSSGKDSLVLRAKKRGIRALQKPFNVSNLREDYVHFCTPQEGADLIVHDPDGFFTQLTQMDRFIRRVSDGTILQYLAKESVQEWTKEEQAALRPNLEARQKLLRERYPNLDFPGIVYLIKTNGKDEGGFAYARGPSIIIPESRIPEFKEDWKDGPYMLDHENTHLLMNANPAVRCKMAEHLGFSGSHAVDLSHPNLHSNLVTNPDVTGHYVTVVTIQGKPVSVLPVAYYEGKYGGETLREAIRPDGRLKLKFLEIDPSAEVLKPVFDQERPRLYDLEQVTGFREQIGGIVPYAAPLDEALADILPALLSQESPSGFLKGIDDILRRA